MGLIKSLAGSVTSVLGDQWREYFYCNSIPNDVLMTRGVKRASSSKTSNTDGYDNIISNGSVIAVAANQCMLIVDNGKVVEICAEPGEFTYDSSTEPTIFYGDLGTNIAETFKNIGKRFTFGADAPKDQRVYYINTKEILSNKYGTVNPVPFRFIDKNINLDIDGTVKCHGEYSFKITDPIKFYTNLAGNVTDEYKKDEILSQLRSEVLNALQPSLAKVSAMGVRYSELMAHTKDISKALNDELSGEWGELRGLEIVSFTVIATAPTEIEELIRNLQRTAVLRDPMMANARLTDATAEAMQAAASNEATGPMMAFAGMNMAGNTGGAAANLTNTAFQYQAMQNQAQNQVVQNNTNTQTTAPQNSWNCECGASNEGKFCTQCGKPNQQGWTCSCSHVNKGKFCSNCGKAKPQDALLYKCDKCGWEPEDAKNPPKFCPECGDVFNEGDVK